MTFLLYYGCVFHFSNHNSIEIFVVRCIWQIYTAIVENISLFVREMKKKNTHTHIQVDKNIKRRIQYKDLHCELELQGCLNLRLRMKICVNNSIWLNRTITHLFTVRGFLQTYGILDYFASN